MNKKILGVALSVAFASGSAQADIITDNFLNAFETTEISQTGSLAQFNTALGTLSSVTLTVSGDSDSSSILTNNAANPQSFDFLSVLNFFFDVTSVGLTSPTPVFTTTLATTGGFVNLGNGASLDLGQTIDSGNYIFNVSGGGLAAFEGAGTFDVSCFTISGTNFSGGGGNIDNAQNTTARCGAEVSYNYDVAPTNNNVPEPATIALMGLGFGLMGYARRKA